jgi:hypothetical protein
MILPVPSAVPLKSISSVRIVIFQDHSHALTISDSHHWLLLNNVIISVQNFVNDVVPIHSLVYRVINRLCYVIVMLSQLCSVDIVSVGNVDKRKIHGIHMTPLSLSHWDVGSVVFRNGLMIVRR